MMRASMGSTMMRASILFFETSLLLFAPTMAWDGYDYQAGRHIEIENS